MSAHSDLGHRLINVRVAKADERRSRVYRSYADELPRLGVEDLDRRGAAQRRCSLNEKLRTGDYAPSQGYVADRPKRDGSPRKCTILTMEDRLVYEALVRPLRRTVEAALAPRDVVFGPRGTTSTLRWTSFLDSPLRRPCRYVVTADVANSWDSMSHEVIARTLSAWGCEQNAVTAVAAFLGIVMDGDRGLPIRLGSSECLASALLSNVDRQVGAQGWRYARCADDLLVAVDSEVQGREALESLAAALGSVGLGLREERSRVIERTDYEAAEALGRVDRIWERASGWGDGRYLHAVSVARVRSLLRRLRSTPTARADALESAREAVEPQIGARRATRLLSSALALMTSVRDPSLLPLLDAGLSRSPDLTPLVARYLRALLGSSAPQPALDAGAELLRRPDMLDAQRAWLCRALLAAPQVAGGLVVAMEDAVASPHANWVLRTEAARLLMARHATRSTRVRQLAAEAPPQFVRELHDIAGGIGLSLAC